MLEMTKRTIKETEIPIPFEEEWNNSDLVIAIINGEERYNIYAHKAILSLASPVFDRMFKSDFKESNENLLELKDNYYTVLYTLKMIYPQQDFNLGINLFSVLMILYAIKFLLQFVPRELL